VFTVHYSVCVVLQIVGIDFKMEVAEGKGSLPPLGGKLVWMCSGNEYIPGVLRVCNLDGRQNICVSCDDSMNIVGPCDTSERWRSAFRGDGDRDSELMPITIPS
jgi:hypothetical protein